ncbi:MAG: MMPL family transporter [Methylococcaceae bacterium]|nr:MMPL family transporter [Methylococcaceae bacterium]
MSKTTENLVIKTIHWWEENILNRPWWLLMLSVIVTGFIGQYAYQNLTVNTNTADMISIELPFQKNRIKLETTFPQDVSTVLLMVEGPTPEQTSEALKRISAKLVEKKDFVKSVYLPDESDFFERNGMLYLSLKELQDISTQLANAQPFIGKLSVDNSLHGLFDILGKAVKAQGEEDFELDLNAVFRKIREALQAVQEGRPYQLSWQQLMMDQHQTGLGVTKRFIVITPILNFSELLPAEKSIAAINAIIAESLTGELTDTHVRMTGEVVLEHEEMQTVGQGTAVAGIASMILVCVTLWIAYRSFKLMFSTFFTLTMGLVLSLGFATVAVGHLNLISIAFAVLFIGMGDAYSSHFCLRYRELILRGESQRDALRDTLTSTGASLILCTLTAALGLYAFIPTNYVGVSELGIIAGTSMFIALLTTFTVLPALMKIMPIKPSRKLADTCQQSFILSNWPLRYARTIRWITLALTLVSAGLLTRVTVDFNPINLRDQNTESVKTFKYLLKSKDTSPMTLASLAYSEQEVIEKKAAFEKLPTVDKVVSLLDFIPKDQEAKLALLEELGLILGPQLDRFPPPAQGGATVEALEELQAKLQEQIAKAGGNVDMIELNEALDNFLEYLDSLSEEARQAILDKLQSVILSGLPATMDKVRHGLEAEAITRDNLPRDLVERWLSKDGIYRIQVFPRKNLNDLENLREFIQDAQQVDKSVTDLPVTYLESMNEVIRAFQQAFGIALIATTLLLLAILRNVKDTLLVLLPLLLASLFTAAATVIFNVPFNFANIIALPLLFGLGVDSGIHMVHRLHYLNSDEESLLGTSEAQGVFYGALTTIFSFSSLAFTAHRGMASMGILLSVGLLMTLICALVVLPAFSALRFRHLR